MIEDISHSVARDATGVPVPVLRASDPPAEQIISYWRSATGVSNWLGEDVFRALYSQFVERVSVSSSTLEVIRDRPVIYLANHQVALESLVFVFALTAISRMDIRALAKEAHQDSWVGELLALLFSYPGQRLPPPPYYRNEYDPQSLVDMLAEMRRSLTEDRHALLIHAEGARVLSCRRPISQLSSVFIDLARETGASIVPVHFSGGLPVNLMDNYRDFPVGFGRQTYHLGDPIEAEVVAACHPRDRRQMVVEAINTAGSDINTSIPAPENPSFLEGVQNFLLETATTQVKAVMVTGLRSIVNPSEQTERVLAAVSGDKLMISDTPEDEWLGRMCTWLTDGRARIIKETIKHAARL